MYVVRQVGKGVAIGLPLAVVLWSTLTVLDLEDRLDRQTKRAGALAGQVDDLEANVESLEAEVEDLSGQLVEAIPRIRKSAAVRACEEAVAAGPALPADWTYHCASDSADEMLGAAVSERWLGGDAWGGTIEIYSPEHLDYGSVDSAAFHAELVDTIYHEAHHSWCLRAGGTVDHSGPYDQVPECSVPVPVGPPVGEWGTDDG